MFIRGALDVEAEDISAEHIEFTEKMWEKNTGRNRKIILRDRRLWDGSFLRDRYLWKPQSF